MRQILENKFNIILDKEPTLEAPTSQLPTENQFHSSEFLYCCTQMHEKVQFHRKLWEYAYVLQVLKTNQMLGVNKKGLGFAVGLEPLVSIFAKYGCNILATDQDINSAKQQGWVSTNEYAIEKQKLNSRGICDPHIFNERVDLQTVDMNNINPALSSFDFLWSCCSFEHLGSLDAGINFVVNSMQCLKPGGIAVHTTEYNLSSDTDTLEQGITVIYRRQDILRLAQTLIQYGYEVFTLNLTPGSNPFDYHVDIPPYKQDIHIKLLLSKYITTSIGIIIRKPLNKDT